MDPGSTASTLPPPDRLAPLRSVRISRCARDICVLGNLLEGELFVMQIVRHIEPCHDHVREWRRLELAWGEVALDDVEYGADQDAMVDLLIVTASLRSRNFG